MLKMFPSFTAKMFGEWCVAWCCRWIENPWSLRGDKSFCGKMPCRDKNSRSCHRSRFIFWEKFASLKIKAYPGIKEIGCHVTRVQKHKKKLFLPQKELLFHRDGQRREGCAQPAWEMTCLFWLTHCLARVQTEEIFHESASVRACVPVLCMCVCVWERERERERERKKNTRGCSLFLSGLRNWHLPGDVLQETTHLAQGQIQTQQVYIWCFVYVC